jgi:hypothetical protein
MTLAQKDINTTASTNNVVTFTRYRVTYRRADGRNVPGLDVPYAFDGAATFTVTPNGGEFTFLLVRSQAKVESPLVQLADNGTAFGISTLAEVTFYGKDQVGNEVIVSGQIGINFANWGDPS